MINKQILEELSEALRISNEDILRDLINKYKNEQIDKKNFLLSLKEFNINYGNKEVEDEKENTFQLKFVSIEGLNETITIKIKDIVNFSKSVKFDITGRKKYYLILNKENESKLFMSNTYLEFLTENQRNFAYGDLKKKLKNENQIKFL